MEARNPEGAEVAQHVGPHECQVEITRSGAVSIKRRSIGMTLAGYRTAAKHGGVRFWNRFARDPAERVEQRPIAVEGETEDIAELFLFRRLSHAALRCNGRASACLLQLPHDAILNPMWIPPFGGVHELAVHNHAEMQMIAARHPCLARQAEPLSFVDILAFFHLKGG